MFLEHNAFGYWVPYYPRVLRFRLVLDGDDLGMSHLQGFLQMMVSHPAIAIEDFQMLN